MSGHNAENGTYKGTQLNLTTLTCQTYDRCPVFNGHDDNQIILLSREHNRW